MPPKRIEELSGDELKRETELTINRVIGKLAIRCLKILDIKDLDALAKLMRASRVAKNDRILWEIMNEELDYKDIRRLIAEEYGIDEEEESK